MSYLKPWKNYSDQLDQLIGRGIAPFEADTHARARCFLLLKITRHLLGVINPRSSWPNRMKAHLLTFPDLSHLGLNLAGMGTPGGWDDLNVDLAKRQ